MNNKIDIDFKINITKPIKTEITLKTLDEKNRKIDIDITLKVYIRLLSILEHYRELAKIDNGLIPLFSNWQSILVNVIPEMVVENIHDPYSQQFIKRNNELLNSELLSFNQAFFLSLGFNALYFNMKHWDKYIPNLYNQKIPSGNHFLDIFIEHPNYTKLQILVDSNTNISTKKLKELFFKKPKIIPIKELTNNNLNQTLIEIKPNETQKLTAKVFYNIHNVFECVEKITNDKWSCISYKYIGEAPNVIEYSKKELITTLTQEQATSILLGFSLDFDYNLITSLDDNLVDKLEEIYQDYYTITEIPIKTEIGSIAEIKKELKDDNNPPPSNDFFHFIERYQKIKTLLERDFYIQYTEQPSNKIKIKEFLAWSVDNNFLTKHKKFGFTKHNERTKNTANERQKYIKKWIEDNAKNFTKPKNYSDIAEDIHSSPNNTITVSIETLRKDISKVCNQLHWWDNLDKKITKNIKKKPDKNLKNKLVIHCKNKKLYHP